ncbi:GumC family protein [Ampullimonas aquatilis]|uniref:GumC family protein n=1 Tax=Ampullimonas aquatilis TaxID=1341549 RepID=UPI003C7910D7
MSGYTETMSPAYAMSNEDESGLSIAEYLSVFKRRRLLIGLVAAMIFTVAVLLAFLLPSVYRSSATILIQEQEIPQDLVRSTVTSFADERMQVISQQVMTRAVLMQMIDKYGLYEKARRYKTSEEILTTMRENIKLTPISAEVTDRKSGTQTKSTIAFSLTFDNDSAANAQKIANELVSLFLNENLKNRQQKAEEASSFLGDEADRLSKQIESISKKISEFKRKNQGKLPELNGINQQMSERADSEMMQLDRQLMSLQERKIYLEGQLASIKPNNPITSANGDHTVLEPKDRLKSLKSQLAILTSTYSNDHPDIRRIRREIEALKQEVGDDSSDDFSEKKKQLQASLEELKQRYSDDHPDVQKLKRSISALELQGMANKSNRAKDSEADNPTYLTFKAQLESAESEIRSTLNLKNELRQKLSLYEARLQQAPEVEKDYFELARELEAATLRFREVKAKQQQADVAQQMEKDSKSERFTLIDPPQFPEKAASPNRVQIILIGFIFSLVGGIGAGGIREALDQSVRSSREVMRILNVPVLSVVPLQIRPDEVKKRKLRRYAIAAAILLMFLGLLLVVNFFYMPLDVLWYGLVRRIPI